MRRIAATLALVLALGFAAAPANAETIECRGFGLHSKTGACINVGWHRNRRGVIVADYVSWSTPSDSAYEDCIAVGVQDLKLFKGTAGHRKLKAWDPTEQFCKRPDGQVYHRWTFTRKPHLGRHRGSVQIIFKAHLDGQSDQWVKLNGNFG